MTVNDKIRDEKLQYEINREAALSSGQICKHECLTGEEIFSFNQIPMIEHVKLTYLHIIIRFIYYPLGKALEKQTKKQVAALNYLDLSNKIDELKLHESIFPRYQKNYLITDKLKKWSNYIIK